MKLLASQLGDGAKNKMLSKTTIIIFLETSKYVFATLGQLFKVL